MSSLTATASGPSDLLLGKLSGRTVASVPSRPDESFWKDVFDQAETLGLATSDASLLPQQDRTSEPTSAKAKSSSGEPSGMGNPTKQAAPSALSSSSESLQALIPRATTDAGHRQTLVFNPASNLPPAGRWQAEQSYGLTPAELIAQPALAQPTQAPAAVNATVVTLPNGELKLYLRAASLTVSQAIEAAFLPDLSWASGQASTITEVVLNGQTIYTRGVSTAPSFILTC